MKKTYLKTYLALLLLLAATTGSVFLNLGSLNEVLNLTIAVIKAVLVIGIFMQVKWAKKPVIIFVLAGFVWLSFLVTITWSDYLTRKTSLRSQVNSGVER